MNIVHRVMNIGHNFGRDVHFVGGAEPPTSIPGLLRAAPGSAPACRCGTLRAGCHAVLAVGILTGGIDPAAARRATETLAAQSHRQAGERFALEEVQA